MSYDGRWVEQSCHMMEAGLSSLCHMMEAGLNWDYGTVRVVLVIRRKLDWTVQVKWFMV